ncbi:MAG: PetM of cytochrome b6f complex subunit 7 [Gloeomargaritaceae cyanobacterium C42_A2020_066]|nr:PetM of cytochrome b6f complex subunit 7 [Gloeomargaritaceae cyanobacterium C42_A2020_066]
MASEILTTAVVVLTMVMVGLTLGFVLIKLSGESSAGRLIKIVGKEE